MSDFTFKEFLTGILKFNDENVMHIGFNSDTEDIIITNWNAAADTAKTLQTNLNGGGVQPGYFSGDDIATRNITGDIVLEEATIIKNSAFRGTGITSLTGLYVTQCEDHALAGNTSLTELNLPELIEFPGAAGSVMADNPSLTEVHFPKMTNVGGTYAFSNDTSLAVADLGLLGSTKNYMFNNCPALRTLILRKTGTVTTASAANAGVFGGIYNNPDESTIYVPESMITTYQNATNWSALYSMGVTFAKLEGSIYE